MEVVKAIMSELITKEFTNKRIAKNKEKKLVGWLIYRTSKGKLSPQPFFGSREEFRRITATLRK